MKIIYKPCPNQCFSTENASWLPLQRAVIAIQLVPQGGNWAYCLMNFMSVTHFPTAGRPPPHHDPATGMLLPLRCPLHFALGGEIAPPLRFCAPCEALEFWIMVDTDPNDEK